jgi:threonine/homoserine/homoserine lactone efflux protein
MSPDQVLALALFATVSSITPGPNNTMMLASGLNFGVWRSLPHLAGITVGFCVLVLACGLGVHVVLARWPVLESLIRYAGAAYLLWLAWKLANAGPMAQPGAATSQPMGFWAAAAFQWVNPKAWVMALGAISAFLPGGADMGSLLSLVLVFGLVNAPCVLCWAAFGSALRSVLRSPRWMRVFNVTLALLLVASLLPLLADRS